MKQIPSLAGPGAESSLDRTQGGLLSSWPHLSLLQTGMVVFHIIRFLVPAREFTWPGAQFLGAEALV